MKRRTRADLEREIRVLLNRYSLHGSVPCDELDKVLDGDEGDGSE